ncbi:MAG: LysR family transcriptional regulator, partial [Pseudomonadota bacterium]
MIEDYRALAVFVAVADNGSFTQAGRHLHLSTSVVSHHISRLEEKLGISLFFRSTRAMSLTPEGERMLAPARRMVIAAEQALDSLSDESEQPVGELRITAPAFWDATEFNRRIWRFAQRFPQIRIKLHATDDQRDLIKEGFDLALRFGELSDSNLKSKRIGSFRRVLVSSPQYLKTRPPIKHPDDLQHCEFIA